MDRSIDFLNSLDISQNYIILGCSGGPDSMCLLNVLYKMNFRIVCAHVNHNIRLESAKECEFVKNYCEEIGIVFEELELPPNLNQNESFYRKKRYDFYKSLADKYKTPYIATAHHGDDLIETILMRISRGSHLKGYSGFSKTYKEKNYVFIKPLIFYSKEEIETYNKKNSIPYVVDGSNEQDTYTRNRYRHNVLPFLKKENREIHKKFLQYSEELNEATVYIDAQVEKVLEKSYDGKYLNLIEFEKLEPFIKKKVLEAILKRIFGDDVDNLRLFHIQSIIEQIHKGHNFSLDLPLSYKVIRVYDKFNITKVLSDSKGYFLKLEKKTVLPNGDIIEFTDDSLDTSNYITRLNSKDLKLPLYIRTRKNGDKIEIKNMKGTKKIADIFIDSKINPSKRDDYPILVDASDRIIWLPGLRKSKFDNEKGKKYDIILKYTKKGK